MSRIVFISVRNYSADMVLGKSEIDEEILRAERIIPDDTYSAVVIIACTNYEKNIMEQFGGKGFQIYSTDGKIREVILLNLTSPQLRAKFCGKDSLSDGIPGLEILVEKTQSNFETLMID